MWWDRERPWTALVPPATAATLMLLYFWLFDRWDKLENPIQSQLAIFSAIAGFLAGIAAQRIRNWLLLAIPGAVTVAVFLWAYFAPHDTPSDNEFRQALIVLTVALLAATIAVNLPQIVGGRQIPPAERERLT